MRTADEGDRKLEPIPIHPHYCLICSKIPFHLLCDSGLLNFDRNPRAWCAIGRLESSPVYLRDTGTGHCALVKFSEYSVGSRRLRPELADKDSPHGLVGHLWCVVKQTCKLCLYGSRKDYGIMPDGLTCVASV